MIRARILAAGLFAGIIGWLAAVGSDLPAQPQAAPQAGLQAAPAGPVKGPDLFKSREGKSGWKVILPGNKPLATPAVADGKLFLGGGFGSHEFYGFDAVN